MSDYEFWGLPGEDLFGDPFDSRLDRKLRRKMLGAHICFGGGKGGSKAPAPDPQIGEAALKQAQLGEDWLAFAKEQFAVGNDRQIGIDDLSKRVTDAQLAAQDQAIRWAEQDRNIQQGYRDKYDAWAEEDRATGQKTKAELEQLGKDAIAGGQRYQEEFSSQAEKQFALAKEQQDRYRNTFQPVENRLASDAMTWDSEERQAEMAAQAKANVLANASSAQQQSNRQMASMGVDPRSGRFSGATRAGNLNTALAAAGAQNQARDAVRQQGIALRGQAAAIGQNVAQMGNQANAVGMQATGAAHTASQSGMSQALQAKNMGLAASGIGNTAAQLGMGNQGGGYQGLGLGVSAGSSALGSQLGANSAFQQNNSIMGQGFQGGMQGYAGQASTMNSLYGNQMNAWSAQAQQSSANAAGLMSGVGSIAGMAMAYYSSKDVKVDKKPAKGSLDAVQKMPVEEWKYKDGVEDGGRHVGPYAEDFHKATGKGDGTRIPIQDAIGVTMGAIQELAKKVDRIEKGERA